MQDIEARLPTKVEHPEQLVLLRNVFRAADLVVRHVKGEELSQPGRLHFDHSFRIVGIVKRDDVKPKAIADVLRSPNNPLSEIITTSSLQTIPLQVEDELLAEFAETTIGSIKFCEVDLPGLTHQKASI